MDLENNCKAIKITTSKYGVIQQLSSNIQISWKSRLTDKPFFSCYVSIDGTDCPIEEPQDFDPKWYSHKINRSDVRYEIGLTLRSKKIVWVYGPFACGKNPDISIFRSYLKAKLKLREKVLADSGYQDVKCVTPSGLRSLSSKLHSKLRARHERLNMCFKKFRVLSSRFRHEVRLHQFCFGAIASIVQLTLHEHPLFGIHLFDDR